MELQKKLSIEISNLFSCPSSFLEKKEIRKRQGRYIRTKLYNMDPEHVISKMELQDPTVSSYIVCCILGCCITMFYFYLYDTGLVYYSLEEYADMAWVSVNWCRCFF